MRKLNKKGGEESRFVNYALMIIAIIIAVIIMGIILFPSIRKLLGGLP